MQQVQLKQATTIRNFTLWAALLLLIIVGLIYNLYRANRRNNIVVARKNDALQKLVDEKEWLLKEIHHRVKNNLHTITSLLESQSRYLQNDALSAIKDSQHRVHAMSLIHQKLYNTDTATTISLPVYIDELLNYLKESFDAGHLIQFVMKIDPIELDIAQAVPLGLILNEAITNAFKYAFPVAVENKKISIIVRQSEEDFITLVVSDNGIGLPEDFDETRKGSLGLVLMKGLSREIKGDFAIYSDRGTTVTVRFGSGKFPKLLKDKFNSAYERA